MTALRIHDQARDCHSTRVQLHDLSPARPTQRRPRPAPVQVARRGSRQKDRTRSRGGQHGRHAGKKHSVEPCAARGSRSGLQSTRWQVTVERRRLVSNNLSAPVAETLLDDAQAPFLADRAKHVRGRELRDYKDIVEALRAAVPKRAVHSIKTADIQTFLSARNVGQKRWNNLRGDLHAFFAFCQAAPRQWTNENPVTPIQTFRISRGVPEIITAPPHGI
jgi:hypothetical protein